MHRVSHLDPEEEKGEILIKGETSLERLTPLWINIWTKALNSAIT